MSFVTLLWLLATLIRCAESKKFKISNVAHDGFNSISFDAPMDNNIPWTIGDEVHFIVPISSEQTASLFGRVEYLKNFGPSKQQLENIYIHGVVPPLKDISLSAGTFSMAFYSDSMSANIQYPGDIQFELRPSMKQQSNSGLTKSYVMSKVDMLDKYYSKDGEEVAAKKRLFKSQSLSQHQSYHTKNVELEATANLKVLVLYTSEAVTAAGGETSLLSLISLAIGNYNVALQNSLVDMAVDYVAERIQEYNTYVEDNSADPFGVMLGQMGSTLSTSRRNLLSCHAVHLVISKAQYCGLGYYSFNGLTSGYSVGCYSCIGGYMTLAHEVGHNIGLEHDLSVSPGTAINHGYCWDDASSTACHRSVMAYANCVTPLGRTNCARVKYFSNPSVTEVGNVVGTASQCNNAQQLRNNINNFMNQFTPSFTPGATVAPSYSKKPSAAPIISPSLAPIVLGTLANKGFESGLAYWTSAGTTSAATTGCYVGTGCAMVGATTLTNGDSSLTQSFTATAGQNQLSFWYKMTCPDTISYDWATATLTDNTLGATETILAKVCITSTAWTQVTVSLIPGRSYTLMLLNHDDNISSDPSYTLYDNVELLSVTLSLPTLVPVTNPVSSFSPSVTPSTQPVNILTSNSISPSRTPSVVPFVTPNTASLNPSVMPVSLSLSISPSSKPSIVPLALVGVPSLAPIALGVFGNAGFENGLAYWTSAGTTSAITTGCYVGTGCAMVGATVPTNGDSSLSQSFTATAGQNQLSFWYKMTCPDTISYDWATATLTDNTLGTTTTILTNVCITSTAWTQVTASLVPGRSYTLALISHDDNFSSDASYTLYDSIELLFAISSSPTAVPVSNPVSSFSPSVTPSTQPVNILTTNSISPSLPPVAPGKIENSGFENGLVYWTSAGTTSAITTGCYVGTGCAMVGATTATLGDSSLSQSFTAATGQNQLSFWYKMTCPDTISYDWATATLTDNALGTTETILANVCTTSTAWVQVTASLIPSRSYTLALISHDDNYASDASYTLYDNVELLSVTLSSPTAVPVTNPVSSFSPSVTPSTQPVNILTSNSISPSLPPSVTPNTASLNPSVMPVSLSSSISPSSKPSIVPVAPVGVPSLAPIALGTIENAGFENGLAYWTSAGTTSAVTTGCYVGTGCAMVGATVPTNGDSSLSQSFTATAGQNQLSFWYKMTCPDTISYDWATATLTDNTLGTTETILTKVCTTSTAWTQVTVSLIPGRSYTVTLISHDDNYASDASYTFYDNVAIATITASPTVISTFSPSTPTVVPSKTPTRSPLFTPSTWSTVSFSVDALTNPILMTDGCIMFFGVQDSKVFKLTPDAFGNYKTGTVTQLASLPAGYCPLYFASATLTDGRILIIGGEYNCGPAVWTNLGAIYNPLTNVWTSVTLPSGYSQIGDAASIVLPDGTFLLQDFFHRGGLALNTTTMTWTPKHFTGKLTSGNEEGWTLLPNGKILSVCIGSGTCSELYNPATDTSTSAGNTGVTLWDSALKETGAAIMRPDGKVLAIGSTGNTAIYDSNTGVWVANAALPISPLGNQCTQQDGPAALLRNGNILFACSGGAPVTNDFQNGPSFWYEFDVATSKYLLQPSVSISGPSYIYFMMVLPTGDIIQTSMSSAINIYTSFDMSYSNDLRPLIELSSAPNQVAPGQLNIKIRGTYFNGFSQGSGYGDDYAGQTHFPLVRITITATNHVFYCRTHGHSSMAIKNPNIVHTYFDVPANIELGAGILEVVANGIPSLPLQVTVGILVPTVQPVNILSSNSKSPSQSPTKAPITPTSRPSTKSPTKVPTIAPTKIPIAPTSLPSTKSPTKVPTRAPTRPTAIPTKAPIAPTKIPTKAPLSKAPTKAPLSKAPTKAPLSKAPTRAPTRPTVAPTKVPTVSPSITKNPSGLQAVGNLQGSSKNINPMDQSFTLPIIIVIVTLIVLVGAGMYLYYIYKLSIKTSAEETKSIDEIYESNQSHIIIPTKNPFRLQEPLRSRKGFTSGASTPSGNLSPKSPKPPKGSGTTTPREFTKDL